MSTKEYQMSGFNRISVRFAMEVEIVRADEYSISISGSDKQLENINAVQQGDRLTLSYNLNLASILAAPFSRVHARITLPELRELNITGAARGTLRGFSSNEAFDLYVSGASYLDISEMSVDSLKWDLTGASRITGEIKASGDLDIRVFGASRIDLKGEGRNITVDAGGASHIDLEDFRVENGRFKLTGASHCKVNLNGKLDVTLDGASRLEYNGQPSMGEVRVTGASTFKHR